jgi:uncharacterized protein DUF4397
VTHFRSSASIVSGFLLLLAIGCGGGGSHTQLRVLQGSADAGNIDVLVDGTTLISSLAFASPSKYESVSAGSRHLQIEQTGTTTPIIDENVSLDSGAKYTLLTENFVSAITPLLLVDNTTAPSSGNFQIRLVNDMPSVGNIDVYVVAPGTIPGQVPPTVSNLSLDAASSYLSMLAGTYDIIVTGPGNVFTYFDSGPVSFTGGQNRTVVLLSNISGYGSVTLADLN